MKNGMLRFNFYSTQLDDLLKKAAADANPAAWLHVNNARTPLFMLEALAKLYSELHNKPRFKKIKEQFKQLEDMLGQVDYYDGFVKELSKNEGIPGLIIGYLERKKQEKLLKLNELLIKEKWIGKKKSRLQKIMKKIADARWMKEKKEMEAIRKFYKKAIEEINVFYRSAGGRFTELENQVHALRRKLRWLSIYPQALRGSIQLTENKAADDNIAKYLQPEIITSAFVKMPDVGNNTSFLLLEKNYFYALSWMIAGLGKLKDAGLSIIAVNEALAYHKDNIRGNIDAIYKAASSGETMESILLAADKICKDYFDENDLEKMIGPVSNIES